MSGIQTHFSGDRLGGKLGKVKRLVIPSRVVKLVRDIFSEADGQYTGIKTVIESVHDLF
jgi:hypothetical protein